MGLLFLKAAMFFVTCNHATILQSFHPLLTCTVILGATYFEGCPIALLLPHHALGAVQASEAKAVLR